jgi:hypothetical protein
VVRFDHFCPWTNNAVGVANHKLFLLFCGYTCAACGYSMRLIVAWLGQCARDEGYPLYNRKSVRLGEGKVRLVDDPLEEGGLGVGPGGVGGVGSAADDDASGTTRLLRQHLRGAAFAAADGGASGSVGVSSGGNSSSISSGGGGGGARSIDSGDPLLASSRGGGIGRVQEQFDEAAMPWDDLAQQMPLEPPLRLPITGRGTILNLVGVLFAGN